MLGTAASGQTRTWALVALCKARSESSTNSEKRSAFWFVSQIKVCGMLGCTSTSSRVRSGEALWARRLAPKAMTPDNAAIGRIRSPSHALDDVGFDISCRAAWTSETENHTIRKDTP